MLRGTGKLFTNGTMQKNGRAKNVSMKDIAAKLNLSKAAVSFALNGSQKVSEQTRKKVLAAARRLGYRKSPVISAVLASVKTRSQFMGTVALVNANPRRDAYVRYPIFSKYAQGAKSMAQKLGFAVDDIWLGSLSPQKLEKILTSRGIRGALILGHTSPDSVPPEMAEVLKNFIVVSVGIKLENSDADCVCADKFRIAEHAAFEMISRGYSRIMFVLDEGIDNLVDGRFVGGFLRAQLSLPEADRIPPFLELSAAEKNPRIFSAFFKKYKPDAVLSISETTNERIGKIGFRFPENVAVVRLENTPNSGDWKAIDLNYETVGAEAMKRLADYLNSPYSDDLPRSTQLTTVVSPRWSK